MWVCPLTSLYWKGLIFPFLSTIIIKLDDLFLSYNKIKEIGTLPKNIKCLSVSENPIYFLPKVETKLELLSIRDTPFNDIETIKVMKPKSLVSNNGYGHELNYNL